jgi:hypothetical protein
MHCCRAPGLAVPLECAMRKQDTYAAAKYPGPKNISSRRDCCTHSGGTTMMVSLGMLFVAFGCGAITLESASKAFVCFSVAFVLIRYA